MMSRSAGSLLTTRSSDCEACEVTYSRYSSSTGSSLGGQGRSTIAVAMILSPVQRDICAARLQRRTALAARAESSDDRHRALCATSTGVATTCVTGTPYSARARSTTSKRCHTEYSGGNVAITI